MTFKQTLTSMVLAGAVALGSAGCRNPSQYTFEGKIGKEDVSFETGYEGRNRVVNRSSLAVQKPDGRLITYRVEEGFGLKLESVTVEKNHLEKTYSVIDENDTVIMKEAQRQFDGYLPLLKTAHVQQQKELEQERIKAKQQRIKDNPQRIKQALEYLK